jgi:putative DNA primase/helicase
MVATPAPGINSAGTGEQWDRQQRLADGHACLDEALRLLRLYGWPVLSLCPPDHHGMSGKHLTECTNLGKVPWHKWKHLQDCPPTADEVRDLWRQHPDANLGLALGYVSKLVRVDSDGPAGEAELQRLSGGDLPATLELTGGRPASRGLLYRIPDDAKVKTTAKPFRVGEELRLQAQGAQTVLPPSRHASGRLYAWKPGHGPGEIEPRTAPAWLLAALAPERRNKPAPATMPRPRCDGGNIEKRAVAWLAKLPPAISGQGGHNQTMAAARGVVYGFDLGPERGYEMLASNYNPRCQPPWTEAELRHKCEDAHTVPFDRARGYLRDAEREGQEAGPSLKGHPANGRHDSGDGQDPGDGEPEPEAQGDRSVGHTEAVDDPHRLARLALDRDQHPDGRGLYFWLEEYHRYTGNSYRPVLAKEIKGEVVAAVKAEYDRLHARQMAVWRKLVEKHGRDKVGDPPQVRKVTTTVVNHVMQAYTSLALLPGSVEQPAWLGEAPFPPSEMLACRNVLLHLPSYVHGNPATCEPTPRFFSANALDYDFNPDAPPPRLWLEFLAKLWAEDGASIQALQEWFGYSLLPDTSQQKILLLVGPKRSGKGTIARILTRVVGAANVCNPTLASLGTNFGLWPLLGKSLAVISDARLSGRTDTAVVLERLLSISGEDAQTVDRKNLTPVTTRLSTRFVILTNELPRLHDPSGALVGRLVLLRLTKSWYGKEDVGMTTRLLNELPGILPWSIEGYERLHERGYFVQPETGKKLVHDMEDLGSPVGAFIRERCTVGAGQRVLVRDLFDTWKHWCEEKGRKDHGDEQIFGRNLHAAVPGLEVTQPRTGDGRVRVYEGITLREVDL